jgi:hypothetical protein
MKVYVASSWRNKFQPEVVKVLREDGHIVYDFKDSEGFHWSEVDKQYEAWSNNPRAYLTGLNHPAAIRGYNRDMQALKECDACVFVMPCGLSAGIELGWAKGQDKLTVVYIPALDKPDLMVKVADFITTELDYMRRFLRL